MGYVRVRLRFLQTGWGHKMDLASRDDEMKVVRCQQSWQAALGVKEGQVKEQGREKQWDRAGEHRAGLVGASLLGRVGVGRKRHDAVGMPSARFPAIAHYTHHCAR